MAPIKVIADKCKTNHEKSSIATQPGLVKNVILKFCKESRDCRISSKKVDGLHIIYFKFYWKILVLVKYVVPSKAFGSNFNRQRNANYYNTLIKAMVALEIEEKKKEKLDSY